MNFLHYLITGVMICLTTAALVLFSPFADNNTENTIFSNLYESALKSATISSQLKNNQVDKYQAFLTHFLETKSDIQKVVELGCGNWDVMQAVNIPKRIQYIGVDIVPNLIAKNQEKYAKENISFKVIHNEAYIPSGDLLIIKDVFQNWPNDKIIAFFNKIKDKYKYILITDTFLSGMAITNSEIELGAWRPIDLLKPPFNKESLQQMLDYEEKGNKRVYLLERGY